MRIIKTIMLTIVILGVIGISINLIFPNTIHIIERTTINGLNTYTINIKNYLDNLNNTIHTTPTLNIARLQPPEAEVLGALKYIANILIMCINFMLFPIRVLGYIGTLGLAIIGVNTTNPSGDLSWLTDITMFFRDALELNYI